MADQTNDAVNPMREVAPGLADYTEGVLFGDLWARPGLSPRDRSL
ncbi:MAG TPA: carboxymuconolactone decarboxylase family protein, partial [Thermoleophilia bacterium]|nr:carboxymuconolactone decarboxylase family protein [Thermoleophilia bacterium]